MESVTRQAEAFTYVPESDREKPPEEQTRIVLTPLTSPERTRALDDEDVQEPSSDGAQQLVRSRRWRLHREFARDHIQSVENFPVGKPELFPADGSRAQKEAYLDRMPDVEVYWIGLELRTRAEMKAKAGN